MTGRYAGRVVAVVLSAVGLAGCGSATSDDEASARSTTVTTSSTTSSPATTPTPTTTTAPPLPAAADGTDLTACFDGACEVLVSGPVDIPFADPSIGVMSVVAVSPAGVDLRTVSPSGFTSNLLGQRPDQGGPSVVNNLAVAVVAINGGQAVLRFSLA